MIQRSRVSCSPCGLILHGHHRIMNEIGSDGSLCADDLTDIRNKPMRVFLWLEGYCENKTWSKKNQETYFCMKTTFEKLQVPLQS